MKLTNKDTSHSSSKIKVRINEIDEEEKTVECSHVISGFKIVAFFKDGMKLEVGQIVTLEYRHNQSCSGYIVVDEMIEDIDGEVLETHHIISDGVLYISIIIKSLSTNIRMHYLIASNSVTNIFDSASIIVVGDRVNVKVNNGEIFTIEVSNGNSI